MLIHDLLKLTWALELNKNVFLEGLHKFRGGSFDVEIC